MHSQKGGILYIVKNAAQKTLVDKLNSEDSRKDIFKVARQMTGDSRDVIGEQCVKNDCGNVVVDNTNIRNVWVEHYNSLLNV